MASVGGRGLASSQKRDEAVEAARLRGIKELRASVSEIGDSTMADLLPMPVKEGCGCEDFD